MKYKEKLFFFRHSVIGYIGAVFILVYAHNVLSAQSIGITSHQFEQRQLIYSTNEMFSFDINIFLEKSAPHLVQYSEVISHWSGYSSISPKVLIALIEQQTGLITNKHLNISEFNKPFGDLSEKYGFSKQTEDIAIKLSTFFYNNENKKRNAISVTSTALEQLFSTTSQQTSTDNLPEQHIRKRLDNFYTIYYRLFPVTSYEKQEFSTEQKQDESNNQNMLNPRLVVPPNNLLQLPYLLGKAWYYGGSHTNTGSGTYPQSSLDLNNGGVWGSDTSHLWVAAAAAGRAKVHSSCNLEIVHEGGWSTTYYHLDNIQVRTNDTVSRNQKVANYASNKSQALCQGGHSTGPHQHFSLKKDGRFYHLNDVKLSGFKVHTGRDSYDSNCNYFWLEKNNNKYCAWNKLTNPGVPGGPDPDDDIELKNGIPIANISKTKGDHTYYKIKIPANATELMLKIDGGSGDADMYVQPDTKPTLSNWDCRPYKVTQLEKCSYATPKATTYYVLLHAFSNYNDITLTASYKNSKDHTLENGVPITNLSATKGHQVYYQINVPAKATNLKISVDGGTGDVDMYVKSSTKPTLSEWDCRPYKTTQYEVCSYNTPDTATYYIMLHAFSNYSGITLKAAYDN
ncbi:pre-peptidase C-terminal domain-containing protein [Zooshikella ganghwensis]|uniref:pre-peptidase C-terminal domain-containing protein n=1 Tax=Zooshikella ganghwensis TaxID=202772 RepID=UPI000402D08C|nr:pre-peptidase C-terminal domain-containing protein [Zooshikella ganghwensis]